MSTESPALVERTGELTAIERVVVDATGGASASIVIEGPAGIGKTTLLREAQRVAREAGFLVLTAVASDLESDLGFGVARQLFAPVLHDEALFDGAAALARPVLHIEPGPAAAGDEFAAALHGLHWLTLGLAERSPVLLSIDDAQWSDAESLRWLHYVVRRLEGSPIALLLTVRSGAAESREPLLASLRDGTGTTVLRPAPLSVAATAEFVRTRAPEATDGFSSAAHDVCGGNPYLLGELVSTWLAEGRALDDEAAGQVGRLSSEQVAQSVLLRISRGQRDAVELTRAVAVLGSSATVTRAARLAEVPLSRARELVEMLVDADVLAPGVPLAFRHPLVRQSVYDDMAHASRAVRHGEAAAMLLAEAASDDEVAAQLLLSDPIGKPAAAQVLRQAGMSARRSGSAATATVLLRRALQEPCEHDRARVMYELATAELAAGDRAAEHDLRVAVEAADLDLRVDAVISLGDAMHATGQTHEAIAMLLREQESASSARPDDVARLTAAWGWLALQAGASKHDVYERCRLALHDLLAPASRRGLCVPLAMSARSVSERRRWAHEGWDGGRLVEDHDESLLPLALESLHALDGRLDCAFEIADTLIARAQERGSPLAMLIATGGRCTVNHLAGRLLDAEADATITLDLAVQGGFHLAVQVATANLARTLIERGEFEQAERHLAQIEPAEQPGYGEVLAVRGELRLRQARFAEAVDDLRAAETLTSRAPSAELVIRAHFLLAHALVGLGERRAARALADEKLALVEDDERIAAVGDGLLARADAAEPADRIEEWAETVARLEAMPFPILLSRALLHFGTALRRDRRRLDSRPILQRAYDIARNCDAALLANQAAEEIAASGVRLRSASATGADALSPSERRVCQLAVDGLSNPRIAQVLFVSVKTVETQLSSAYRKLGISGRAELSGAIRPA